MIITSQRCGCPPKHISFPTSDPLSKHDDQIQPNDPHLSVSAQECGCSHQSKVPKTAQKSLQRSNSSITKEKNVSEITGRGFPYKEIEAIINNNRMVLRIQKGPVEGEWDPPCDCATENIDGNQLTNPSGRYGEDVEFRKAEDHQKPSAVHQERIIEPGGSARRIITVVSHPDSENGPPGLLPHSLSTEDDKKDKTENAGKRKGPRPIDLEENPNIFILKIRKKSECSEGRENIDLEFRTPRPWLPKPKISKPIKRPIVDHSVSPDESIEVDENMKGKLQLKDGKKDKGTNGKKKKK